MSEEVTLQIIDEVNCRFINLPPEIRKVLHEKSKIFNPALRYTPAVRMGRFDGKTPYFSIGGTTYVNLLGPIIDYILSKNVSFEIDDLRTYNRDFSFDLIDKDYFSGQVWPPQHQLAGQPIVLRDHQVEVVNVFLNNLQGIVSSPTGSGKSLVTAILSKKIEKYGRSIVIVPNKDLIKQTEKYYLDLGLDVGVYYGDRKDFFKTHTICTWQSLERLRESPIEIGLSEPVTFQKFMQNVVAIICDEVHGVKAQKLSNMLSRELAHIPIRWGLTGTVPKDPHEVVHLTIALGEVLHKLASSDLQDLGILSNCNVKVLQLIDTKAFTTYSSELDYLVTDTDRLDFIAQIIRQAASNGNVLVLVGRKETGKVLEELITDSIFLSGASKSGLRKEHYDAVATSNSKVIIATSGIAAVGLDIPRLHHLFLIECGKSFVKVIQSIGRALRTSKDKNHATIWDITSTCKFAKRHLAARKKYYTEQNFPYKIEKIEWQK